MWRKLAWEQTTDTLLGNRCAPAPSATYVTDPAVKALRHAVVSPWMLAGNWGQVSRLECVSLRLEGLMVQPHLIAARLVKADGNTFATRTKRKSILVIPQFIHLFVHSPIPYTYWALFVRCTIFFFWGWPGTHNPPLLSSLGASITGVCHCT